MEEGALQRVVGELAQRNLPALEVREACEQVVRLLPPLFEADGSGILLVDDTHVLRYVASTDAGAHLLEAVQESTGRGPCVQALVDNRAVVVADLVRDDRWPELAEVLVPNGVRAVLGVPVRVGGVSVGSLNVYSRDEREWDGSDCEALGTIEHVVERLLTGAIVAERQEAVIGQLQRALEVRVTVERAVGVLMALEDLDPAAAFERIRRAARSARRSVQEVAADVLVAKRLS